MSLDLSWVVGKAGCRRFEIFHKRIRMLSMVIKDRADENEDKLVIGLGL